MALSEAGGVYPAQTMISYGGRRHAVKPRKGPARSSIAVRKGGTQSYYVRSTRRRGGRRR